MKIIAAFLVNAGLNFALGLLVARFLGPEEFGRYAVAMAVAVVINTAFFEWLRLSTTRFYSEERQASERVDQAWVDNDAAESDYVASSSLCARAVELLPNCTEQGPTEAAVEPLISVDPGAPCPTT